MWWTWVFFPFSPTFCIIAIIKYFCSRRVRTIIQRLWTISFIFYSFSLLIFSTVQTDVLKDRSLWAVGAIALVAWSRIAEIFHGFYRDAVDRFNKVDNTTDMSSLERIHWLAVSYGENIINFAVLYFIVQSYIYNGSFNRKLNSLADAAYFSAVTITTTGYGDIAPTFALSKMLCIYEALLGTFLLVIVLAIYVGNIIIPSKAAEGSQKGDSGT